MLRFSNSAGLTPRDSWILTPPGNLSDEDLARARVRGLASPRCGRGGQVGYRLPEAPLPGLPEPGEVIDAPPAGHVKLPSGALTAVVLSGIDPRFDQNALQLLQEAESGQMVIALSGLSRISRNSHKLLRVVEFLLAQAELTVLQTLACVSNPPGRRRLLSGLGDLTGMGLTVFLCEPVSPLVFLKPSMGRTESGLTSSGRRTDTSL